MKTLFILLLSACSLFGQAFTQFDPTWPAAYVTVAAGGGGGGVSCTTSNLYASAGGSGDATGWVEGEYFCQKIQNTSPSPLTIKRFGIPISFNTGPTGGLNVVFTALVRDHYSLTNGSTYGVGAVMSTNSMNNGYLPGLDGFNIFWPAGSEPTVPANTDFYIGVVLTTKNGASMNAACNWDGAGSGYLNTAYSAYIGNHLFFSDNRDDMRFQLYTCAADFHPTNIPNTSIFLSYLDLPANTRPDYWTNMLADKTVVFTNMSASLITNSSLGVYFPGTTGNYFKSGQTSQYWNWLSNSVWVVMTPISTPGTWANIISISSSSGWGLYAENGTYGFKLLGTGFGQTGVHEGYAGIQYDITLQPMYNWNGATICTNGVLSLTNGSIGNVSLSDKWLWGIGQDADGDQNMNMYFKYFLMCTNYIFTSQDITNLHAWSLTH